MKKVIRVLKNPNNIISSVKSLTISKVTESWDKNCIVNTVEKNKFRLYKHTAFVIFPKRSLYCELKQFNEETEVRCYFSAIPRFFSDYKPAYLVSTLFILAFLFDADFTSPTSIIINLLLGVIFSAVGATFMCILLIIITSIISLFPTPKQDKELLEKLYLKLEIPRQDDI